MPPSEENSDSHTGGNHHQRGIACSGKLVGSPCCPLSRGLRRFRNRCWKRTRAANCTALHMKSERVFLFESIAATITSGNFAVTATKGSSATAAAPYGRAPTFSPRTRPRTPPPAHRPIPLLVVTTLMVTNQLATCTTADWIREITMSLPTASLLTCSSSARRAPPQARSSGCQ